MQSPWRTSGDTASGKTSAPAFESAGNGAWERKISRETRYFIASIEPSAKVALRAVRSRWGIENELQWVLDIAFREDESRVRKDHGPENLAVLRHMALNLLT